MTTGLDIITSAMRKAGVLTKTETPSSDEASDGLGMLNDLVSSWSNDSLLCTANVTESFSVTSNDGTYTIGSGGDFNTGRPLKIVSAYLINDTLSYPLTVINDQDWSSIVSKTQLGIPNFINFDNGYPTATIKLWPVPASSYTLVLVSEKEIASFTLSADYTFRPGWSRAIIHNLAIEMSPEFGVEVPQATAKIAVESLALIKKQVTRNKSLDVPKSPGLRFNIYSGGYVS